MHWIKHWIQLTQCFQTVVTDTNIKVTYHPLLISFATHTTFDNYLSVLQEFLQLPPVKALRRILQINKTEQKKSKQIIL